MNIEQCPDCGGRGYTEIPIVCMGCDPESEDHQHGDPERRTCCTCHGDKVLSGLALAVRKARGGPAPTPMRGFA